MLQENISSIQNLEVENLKVQLLKEVEKNRHLESQITWLMEQLNTLKRSLYGKKSEKWESEEQLKMVFNEVESELQKEQEEPTTIEEPTAIEVKSHTKKVRGCRKPLPKDLPREVVKIELPESEQVSDSGEKLKVIGWEVSEKLKYEPAKTSVVEYHRAKYGVESGDYEKTAPPFPSVIPKSMVTPELLAAIIVSKYADGLPLYRLEEMFNRLGIDLSRGTMARWVVQASSALTGVRNVLSDKLLESYAISCDETKVQVLKEKGRAPEDNSWMIVRATPTEEKKIALFDYSCSRNQKLIGELFLGYSGNVICDGLNIYDRLESKDLKRFGCNMHARRKFESAAVDGAKNGKGLASQVMDLYKKIYNHEEKIKDLSPPEKVIERNKVQRPLFVEIKTLVDNNKLKIPDKSKLGIAFSYFQSEYKYLTLYLNDGFIPPDNGYAERVIRKFAIGRNNWLFSDTPEGAEASSLFYSLVITAKLNKINPYTALVKIFTEIPLAKTIEDYEQIADYLLSPNTLH